MPRAARRARAAATEVDAAVDYAQHIPVDVIARMLGFPAEDADLFRGFIRDVIEAVDMPAEERAAPSIEASRRRTSTPRIEDHIANPRDDLIASCSTPRSTARSCQPEHVRGTMVLLMIAGIDTTWSAIGAALWHLAPAPGRPQRLVGDPS